MSSLKIQIRWTAVFVSDMQKGLCSIRQHEKTYVSARKIKAVGVSEMKEEIILIIFFNATIKTEFPHESY